MTHEELNKKRDEKASKWAAEHFSDYPYLGHDALEDAYKAGFKAAKRMVSAEYDYHRQQAHIDDLRGL